MARYRILTTYSPSVLEAAPLGRFPQFEFLYCGVPRSVPGRAAYAARNLWRGDFEAILVEGGPEAFILSLFKLLLGRRDKTLFCNMAYFAAPVGGYWRRALVAAKNRILAMGVQQFFVLSNDEVDSYHRVIGIKREKLKFIPYKINTQDILAALDTAEGDFIYAGGDSIRDYETLFEAVRPLGIPVKVLTHLKFPNSAVPCNVEIVGNSDTPVEFYEPCARSLLAVIPIKEGYLRSSGQGTYLGAMFLGKPVIVSDTPGARDLIENQVTGLLVPPGNPAALQAAIEKLAGDADLRRRLGRAAHERVRDRYTNEAYWGNLLALLADYVAARPPRERRGWVARCLMPE